MSEFATRDTRFYERQADVSLSQSNPVSGTIYALLPATTYCRVISAIGSVTFTVQPNLQIHITNDGILDIHTVSNPNTADSYEPKIAQQAAPASQELTSLDAAGRFRGFYLEAKSITIGCETTGGTTSALAGRAKYQRYV